jgi:hypothetical protein
MTTNAAAEAYMRGWSSAASGQSDQSDQASTDPHHATGRAAGIAALACVAGRSSEYRQGWKDAALGTVSPNSVRAYALGVADGEVAKQAAYAAAQKLGTPVESR